jgi:Tol biopolymer transport system component
MPDGTPGGEPSQDSSPALPAGFRLLFREFGRSADTVWAVDPSQPDARKRLTSIGHAADWGTFLSLSPAGSTIAYTALPAGARDPSSEAEVWVVRVADFNSTRIASGADLRFPPAWSPDGNSVYFRRNTPTSIKVIRVSLDAGEETMLIERPRQEASDLSAIGFAGDGVTLYYVEVGTPTESAKIRGGRTSG